MKTLTILLALTFSVMFSSTSFADWKRVSEGASGTTYYVDFESIRKHGGYVYFWSMSDSLNPDKDGDLSYKLYRQGDCNSFRYKILSHIYFKQQMGRGSPSIFNPTNPEWKYPSPDSVIGVVLKMVCAYAK